ncbi:MAG TPA: hypothetical protein VGV37_06265 [Aliidongia sp.]|uniref:hypothetical protein n=1 Tax=Aliidongia sp. TaxID=1914230 RepID=UPI002DDD91AB|nr:hypothetical protein [Aliidongia sp.]HEV2674129.1 hypothetical protein [Aliidongia sp.]
MIPIRSNLARITSSGFTDDQKRQSEFEIARQLFTERKAVVIPFDHPQMQGAFRAIVEGFGEQHYGARRK